MMPRAGYRFGTMPLLVVAGFWLALNGCVAVGSESAPAGVHAPPVAASVATLDRLDGECPDPAVSPLQGRGASDAIVATAFRDDGAWRDHLGRVGPSLPSQPAAPPFASALAVWRIDFAGGESVVRLDAGARPNPGYGLRVAVDETLVQGDLLVMSASVEPPPPGSFQPQVIAHPCVYLHLAPAGYRSVELAGG